MPIPALLLRYSNTTIWRYYAVAPLLGLKSALLPLVFKVRVMRALAKWWDKREEIVTLGFAKAKAFNYEEIKARDFNLDLCGYPHEEEEILDPLEAMSAYQQQRASLNQEIDQVLVQIAAMLGDRA